MDYKSAVIAFTLSVARSMYPLVNLDVQATNAAVAIAATTNNSQEAETLVKIAAIESGFADDVRTCKIMGDNNDAVSLFQFHKSYLYQIGYTRKDIVAICNDTIESAKIALDIIKTSEKYCAKFGMKNADLLGMYVSGKCIKDNWSAKSHWGDGKHIDLLVLTPWPKLTDGSFTCFNENKNRSGWYDE